jgi:hypothetical protein
LKGKEYQRNKERDEQILNEFSANPNMNPLDMIKQFGMLSAEKQKALTPLFEQHFKSQETLAKMNYEQKAKEAEKQAEIEGMKQGLDFLDANKAYVGTTLIPGFKSFTAGGLNRDAVQKRKEIDDTGFWTTDKIYTSLNKGVQNKVKFEKMLELAPNSRDSERVFQAKVDSLRRVGNIPREASPEQYDKIVNEELKNIKSQEKKDAAINKKKGQSSEGFKVRIRSPNGVEGLIDESLVDSALANGGTLVE